MVASQEPITIVKPPSEASEQELTCFQELVLEGGEVQSNGLSSLLRDARALAFMTDSDDLIGVGALKRPREVYRDRIFKNAKAKSDPADFHSELGWLFIKDRHRGKGYSRRLVEVLLAGLDQRSVYATSHSDRRAMHRTLQNCGFIRDGEAWSSRQHEGKLVLFIRRASDPKPIRTVIPEAERRSAIRNDGSRSS